MRSSRSGARARVGVTRSISTGLREAAARAARGSGTAADHGQHAVGAARIKARDAKQTQIELRTVTAAAKNITRIKDITTQRDRDVTGGERDTRGEGRRTWCLESEAWQLYSDRRSGRRFQK